MCNCKHADCPVGCPKNCGCQSQWRDKLPGGLADNKTPADFDKEKLIKGHKIEMEHTNNSRVALEIAMDHLTEDADYYEKLEKMVESEYTPTRIKYRNQVYCLALKK